MSQEPLNTLVVGVLPIIIGLAVALYHGVVQFLPKNKVQHLSDLANSVYTVAHGVVLAVEQSMPVADGSDKKTQAVNDLEAILSSMGLKVAPQLVNSSIESAVNAMNALQDAYAKSKVITASVEAATK